jgi:hypothetical protein
MTTTTNDSNYYEIRKEGADNKCENCPVNPWRGEPESDYTNLDKEEGLR